MDNPHLIDPYKSFWLLDGDAPPPPPIPPITLPLQQLSDHLQEIFSLNKPELSTKDLVASLNGRLYNASYGWGRFWTWIYSSLLWFTNLRETQLKSALNKTHQAFQEVLPYIQKDIEIYQQLLTIYIRDEKMPEEYSGMGKRLTEWNHLFQPFFEFLSTENFKKIHLLFENHFYRKDLGGLSLADCVPPEVPHALSNYQSIIDFETAIRNPIPQEILHLIYKRDKVVPVEEEKEPLRKWIRRLEEARDIITVNSFHNTLKSVTQHIIEFLPPIVGAGIPVVSSTERILKQYGCEYFMNEDPEHIAWRNSLKMNDVVMCNQEAFVIGQRLGQKPVDNDFMHSFSEINNSNWILKIGPNKAYLEVFNVPHRVYPFDFTSIGFDQVDAGGSCAIMPKYRTYITPGIWTSVNFTTQHDIDLCEPFVNALKSMIDEVRMPHPFSANYIALGERNQLLYLCHMNKQIFDFDVVERIIFEMAQGNKLVFQHLMTKSNLTLQQPGKFYRYVVKESLNKVDVNLDLLAKVFDREDAVPITKTCKSNAEKLQTLMVEMKKTKLKEIRVELREEMKDAVAKQIYEVYKKSAAGTMLSMI